MNQDATWYRGRPRSRPHCVIWGPAPPPGKGHSDPPLFGQCLLWPNGRPSQLLLRACYYIHVTCQKEFLPAALRAAQTCRYLIYSEADFEPLLRAKFHPYRCNDEGVGPTKLKFLLRFDRNMEYKRPAGAYPLHDFHKICTVCTSFQDALGVKILLDLLKALWSYGGFKLRGSGCPQIFGAP